MLIPDDLRDLVSDGWKLGCGCLYLLLTGRVASGETTVVLQTSSTNRFVCKQFHGRDYGC